MKNIKSSIWRLSKIGRSIFAGAENGQILGFNLDQEISKNHSKELGIPGEKPRIATVLRVGYLLYLLAENGAVYVYHPKTGEMSLVPNLKIGRYAPSGVDRFKQTAVIADNQNKSLIILKAKSLSMREDEMKDQMAAKDLMKPPQVGKIYLGVILSVTPVRDTGIDAESSYGQHQQWLLTVKG